VAQLCRLSACWLPAAGWPPEMCGLRTRPRTDVDPPRVELPSAGGTSSRRLRGDSLFYHQRGLLQLIHVTRQWFHLEPRTVTESHNTNTGLLFGIAFGSFGTQDVGAEYGHTVVARSPVGHCGQLCAITLQSLSRSDLNHSHAAVTRNGSCSNPLRNIDHRV